jgi:hypothetical protein
MEVFGVRIMEDIQIIQALHSIIKDQQKFINDLLVQNMQTSMMMTGFVREAFLRSDQSSENQYSPTPPGFWKQKKNESKVIPPEEPRTTPEWRVNTE